MCIFTKNAVIYSKESEITVNGKTSKVKFRILRNKKTGEIFFESKGRNAGLHHLHKTTYEKYLQIKLIL